MARAKQTRAPEAPQKPIEDLIREHARHIEKGRKEYQAAEPILREILARAKPGARWDIDGEQWELVDLFPEGRMSAGVRQFVRRFELSCKRY